MLQSLRIENYLLMERVDFRPGHQLNVLTGESGAGKSMVVGAIGLLLGRRNKQSSLLRDRDKKCVLEGVFAISKRKVLLEPLFGRLGIDYDDSTILRREFHPSGKSRCFINDTPVGLDDMQQVGHHMIDMHVQHETTRLGSSSYQLEILDTIGHLGEAKKQYQTLFEAYEAAKASYERMNKEVSTLDANRNRIAPINYRNCKRRSWKKERKSAMSRPCIASNINKVFFRRITRLRNYWIRKKGLCYRSFSVYRSHWVF